MTLYGTSPEASDGNGANLCGPLRISASSALKSSLTQRTQRYAEDRREDWLRFVKGLIALSDAGGELARVLCAPPWALVRGPAAGRGIRTTALVAHLCSQTARAVFIK